MDSVQKAALLSWSWRLDVLLVLIILGALFVSGWRRLRKRATPATGRHLATRWRLASYLAGLALIGLALLSPVDTLASLLFFMHMIQHLLLIMIAPPLLLVANPMPFLLWGLPTAWRHKVGAVLSRGLHRESRSRRALKSLAAPGAVWLFWVISVIGWHDPVAYGATLQSDLVHDLEHLLFFLSSMLFWWHITGAGPHIHRQYGPAGRIAFTLAAIPPNMALGVVLAFAAQPFYAHYTAVPRLWQTTALSDQQIGGVIMWVPGSMMYLVAALLIAGRSLRDGRRPGGAPQWARSESG